MAKKFEAIPTTTLEKMPFTHPPYIPEVIHLDDPALMVMVDFTHGRPATVCAQEPITDALLEMKASSAHALLVIDEDEIVLGVISSEDIQGELPYQIMQEKRIKRSEIPVQQVMCKIEDITAFHMDSLRHKKVGDVLETFKIKKQHYALVISQKHTEDTPILCGLFSASQMSRGMGGDISELTEPDSIIDLQRNLDK